ncbi:MAG: chromate efflux transporter [Bacteroidota bacterium]
MKAVFVHTITAFGGPQSQLGLLLKSLAEKNPFFTKEEVLDIHLFCQMLPGATATQAIALLGYKRGGFKLAFITLLLWILPATLFMSLYSFWVSSDSSLSLSLLRYIQPMALAFLCFGSFKTMGIINNTSSRFIFLISFIFVFVFFQLPWIFPIVILLGGLTGYFIHPKNKVPTNRTNVRIHLSPLILFITIFITAGILSEKARKESWTYRAPFNLFENMYRFGSYVFGGADVLIPVMYNQYVVRPVTPRIQSANKDVIKIERQVFLNAAGVVRAIPGPAFAISAFIGGRSLSNRSIAYQLLGCSIAAIGVFLPSFLLGIFFYPLWENMKNHEMLRRALLGINAAVVGIMFAGAIFLFQDSFVTLQTQQLSFTIPYLLVFLATLLLLFFTNTAAPFIVCGTILLGAFHLL